MEIMSVLVSGEIIHIIKFLKRCSRSKQPGIKTGEPHILKPRLHEQFLCDKFYLFASVRSVYMSNFYLKTKDWRLGSTDDKKNCQFYVLSRLHGHLSICDNFYLPHKN